MLCTDVRAVDFRHWNGIDGIIASPPCTTFSYGAGMRRRDSDLPAEVARAVRETEPRWVVVENVPPFRSFPSFRLLVEALTAYGYYVACDVLNSADFGVPQRRKRLYIVASRDPIHPLTVPQTHPIPAATILDDLPLSARPLAPKTLEKIARAPMSLARLIVVYNGSGRQWQSLDEPLRTVTTINRFLLVDRARGHRMLTVNELRRAMGVPADYALTGSGCRQIRQLGNAVVPAVAEAAIRRVCG